jgi:hypothetical protein
MSAEDTGIASSNPDDGAAVVAGSNPGHGAAAIAESDLQAQERAEDELIMHLERDQFVEETSRPVPRAPLSTRASAGLWALRVFVVIVSLMVIYTFAAQLH